MHFLIFDQGNQRPVPTEQFREIIEKNKARYLKNKLRSVV
jgi:hypothetical protein